MNIDAAEVAAIVTRALSRGQRIDGPRLGHPRWVAVEVIRWLEDRRGG